MRIAHLSDPHLLTLDGARPLDFLNKRILGGLNLLVHRRREHRAEVFAAMVDELNRERVDHILCTGDVTNLAHDAEICGAVKAFRRLHYEPEDVTVLPGNHDAYLPGCLERFEREFADFQVSDTGWFRERWPTIRVRGSVAIIGLCTALATSWTGAWGELGAGQLERLRSILSDSRLADRFRLVAIHHPPAGKPARGHGAGLHDHRAFAEIVGDCGAELVLHGHEHLDLHAAVRGTPVRGIQSATYVGSDPRQRASYRIYTVGEDARDSGRPAVIAEKLRSWNLRERRFETA